MKCPTVTIGIMSTYNALSIPSYDKLITGVYDLKREYASTQRAWTTPVSLDASYLRYPLHQTVQVLPYDFSSIVKGHANLASTYEEVFHVGLNKEGVSYGFTQMEIPKIKRIYDWMIAPQDTKQQMVNRHDFYKFFSEHDIRRGTNFVKTFPEYEEFYNFCKTIQL